MPQGPTRDAMAHRKVAFGEPLVQKESATELLRAAETRLAAIGKARTGPLGVERLEALHALSVLYLELNELKLAERRLLKGLKLAESLYGERSVEFMALNNYLGVLYFKQDRKDKASDTFLKIKDQLEAGEVVAGSTLGMRNAVGDLLLTVQENLAGVLSSLGKHEEAAAVLAQVASTEGSSPSGAVDSKAATAAAATLARRKNGKSVVPAAGAGAKRQSLRKRLSRMIGTASGSTSSGSKAEGLDFFFDMPLGKSSTINSRPAKVLSGPESEVMRVPIVDLLDHISSILADARRNDHIELLFRTALSGAYGDLSKLDEQRIAVRLALLLGNLPEFLDEATAILQRALLITEELFGKDDIQVAVVAGDLGTFFSRKGDLHSAEKLFLRALKIFRSLDFPHPKEEIIYKNLSLLLENKNHTRARARLTKMALAIDDEWVLQQSETDLSARAIAKTLNAALILEKNEKDTPAWYNWRDNERKKALLAYTLEVFRDASRDWEVDLAPKYLTVVLEVHRRLGLSLACVPTDKVGQADPGAVPRQPAAAQRKGPAASMLKRRSGSGRERGGDKLAGSSLTRREAAAAHAQRKLSPRKKAANTMRFMDADVDMERVLGEFFAAFSPSKNDPSFITKTLDRYKARQLALIEALELKYNVTFNSDGSWVSNDGPSSEKAPSSGPRGGDEEGAADDDDNEDANLATARAIAASVAAVESSDSEEENKADKPRAAARRRKPRKPEIAEALDADVDESGTLDPEVSLRQTLSNFYQEFAPDRIEAVDTMLGHFKGRHKALFTALQNKYGVQFLRNGQAISLHSATPAPRATATLPSPVDSSS